MDLLLDTHALLWFIGAKPPLSATARSYIEDPNNLCFVSVASLWEIAIKLSLGKLPLHVSYVDFIAEIANQPFTLLDITIQHTNVVSQLPYPARNHRDPFDRLLVAQSAVEGIPLISCEQTLDAYGIHRIW